MPNPMRDARFSAAPVDVQRPRATFPRPFSWKGTANEGFLNCFLMEEVYPGDTIDAKVSCLVRGTTPLFPVDDTAQLESAVFFVPDRLLWSNFKAFMGENDVSAWTDPTVYTVPKQEVYQHSWTDSGGNTVYNRNVGDYADQFGIPISLLTGTISALPLRAIRACWNEWFRNEAVQDPLPLNMTDTNNDYTYLIPLPVGRVRDYFSTCLPQPQFGDAIRAYLQGIAPVFASDSVADLTSSQFTKAGVGALRWRKEDSTTYASGKPLGVNAGSNGNKTAVFNADNAAMVSPAVYMTPSNLVLNSDVLGSLGLDVNTIRNAFAAQRILEELARSGNRYIESIRAFFGVVSPDARQQRPELIAYSKKYINMSDIVQSAPAGTNQTPLGTVGGYSKTVDTDLRFSYSSTEHGWLCGFFWIRVSRSYCQGIRRQFTRYAFEDWYNPSMAFLGEQPVMSTEIYAHSPSSDIFGYQEAWAELRYGASVSSGLMSPANPGTIGDVWTYTDYYSSQPTLSASWMEEGKANVSRTLAVLNEDQYICDFFTESNWARVLPAYSVPGLVDHF